MFDVGLTGAEDQPQGLPGQGPQVACCMVCAQHMGRSLRLHKAWQGELMGRKEEVHPPHAP